MMKTTNTHTHEEQTYKPDILDGFLEADFTESFNKTMSEIAEQCNQDHIAMNELFNADPAESFNKTMSEIAERYNQDLITMNEFLETDPMESINKTMSDTIANCNLELPDYVSQCHKKRKSE